MSRVYQPDLGSEPDSPFARDGNNKLVRRGYWLDMYLIPPSAVAFLQLPLQMSRRRAKKSEFSTRKPHQDRVAAAKLPTRDETRRPRSTTGTWRDRCSQLSQYVSEQPEVEVHVN